MIGERYDWLVKLIEDVAEACERIARTLRGDDQEEEALAELEGQTDRMLRDSYDHTNLERVDARTAALILRPPGRARSYAALLAAKADLLAARGDQVESGRLAARALVLYLEAAALEPDLERVEVEAIVALVERDPPLVSSERTTRLLEALAQRSGGG